MRELLKDIVIFIGETFVVKDANVFKGDNNVYVVPDQNYKTKRPHCIVQNNYNNRYSKF